MAGQPFRPRQDSTKTITVAATSDSENLGSVSPQLRVANLGSAPVWVKWDQDPGVTADAANDMAIQPGATEVFSTPTNWSTGDMYFVAIAADATGSIEITPGEGF